MYGGDFYSGVGSSAFKDLDASRVCEQNCRSRHPEMFREKRKRELDELDKSNYLKSFTRERDPNLNIPFTIRDIIRLSRKENPIRQIYAFGSSLITPEFKDIDLLFYDSQTEGVKLNSRLHQEIIRATLARPGQSDLNSFRNLEDRQDEVILEWLFPWIDISERVYSGTMQGRLNTYDKEDPLNEKPKFMPGTGDLEFGIKFHQCEVPFHIYLTHRKEELDRIAKYTLKQRKGKDKSKPLGSRLY